MWVPVHKYCDLKVRETRIILIQRAFSFFALAIITYCMFVK